MQAADQQQYLQVTEFIDHDHPAIAAFVDKYKEGIDARAQAVSIYYGVRDAIRYDPFTARMDKESFKASHVLAEGRGWCVPKAILLAACYRHIGIPARLGFADVTNHLSTEKMRQAMQTDVFYWHGYTSVFLEGRWAKATPAFNIQLCEKFNLKPLEFNGVDDSLYHEFDNAGNKHMEYVNERGDYADLPFETLSSDFNRYYPGLFDFGGDLQNADFDAEVAKEVAKQSGR